jgi:hypothetical protein
MELEPRRLQLVGPLLFAEGPLHRGDQARQSPDGSGLFHETGIEQTIIGHRGRRQGETAAGGRPAVDREDQHAALVGLVLGEHSNLLHAVSKKGRKGRQ